MSAIFGEYLIFREGNGTDVELVVYGDEFYARYETVEGYTVIFDVDLGAYCYADILSGQFVSTATSIKKQPPIGLQKHLKESPDVRNAKFRQRYDTLRPAEPVVAHHMIRTIGPNRGLLEGRRVSDGPVLGLTILVEFQDLQSTITTADVDEMLNSANYTRNGNFCSVRDFFRLVSSEQLDYTNVVLGPVRLSKNQAYYKNHLLVEEALDVVAAQLNNDFSRFDSKREGIIDAINVMYAGRTVYEGDLWPHNFTVDLRYGNYRTHFYMLTSMGRSSVDLSIGTYCHESGHLLCRFPDLYDYGERDGDFEGSQGIGVYCIMGSGNHLNRGRIPSPVCAYLRDLVGWTKDQVSLNNTGAFEAKHGDYSTALKYETNKPNEYYLVENRSQLGLDSGLPSSGLAVYHCDWLGSNEWQGGTANRHYQCGLMQADGHLDLEKNLNGGDAGDLFVNSTGIALSNQTTPSTRQWDGADSGLIIGNISMPGDKMTFTIGSTAGGNIARGEVTADMLIPDDQPGGIQSTLTINEHGKVKSIKVRVSIIHTYVGDLQVELIAPSGKRVMLHNRGGGSGHDLKNTWESGAFPALALLQGEPIEGPWVLAIRDLELRDTGRLNWWGLEIEYSSAYQTTEGSIEPHIAIPDANPQGVQSTIAISAAGVAKDIAVTVNISHTYRGDLLVEISAPSGRSATLHNRTGGSQRDINITYDVSSTPALAGFVGEHIQGSWTLSVRDMAAIDTGSLEMWSLALSYV